MTLEDARRFALSLPETTEAPHFNFGSYRVNKKIFATVPPGGEHLHVFVEDQDRERMVELYPQAYEKLWWGKQVVGLRVYLPRAMAEDVQALLLSSWRRKAPRRLLA